MIITPSSVNVFFTGLSTVFSEFFTHTPTFWDKVASLYPMTTEKETIGWMGRIPKFREWVGPRQAHGLAAEGYQVGWKPYELTEKFDKFKIEDDSYGVYSTLAKQMGEQAAKWPDYLMRDALQNGGSATKGLCPDGLTFWNDAHPVDIYSSTYGTYDNNLTLTLTAANFETAYQALRVRLGQDGEPLNLGRKMLLVVPPELEREAKIILMAQYSSPQTVANETMVGVTENLQRGMADLLVLPELSAGSNDVGLNKNTWYLMDVGFPLKPLLFMLRQAPTFAYRISPTDPVVFDEHAFLWGGEARGNYAYALPFLATRSVGS